MYKKLPLAILALFCGTFTNQSVIASPNLEGVSKIIVRFEADNVLPKSLQRLTPEARITLLSGMPNGTFKWQKKIAKRYHVFEIKESTGASASLIARKIASLSGVLSAEPDMPITLKGLAPETTNVSFLDPAWVNQRVAYGVNSTYRSGLDKIAFHYKKFSNNALVFVIDSGYRSHPDLQGKIAKEINFVEKNASGGPTTSAIEPATCDGSSVTFSHGANVVSQIIGNANNQTGVVGLLPDAKVIVARSLAACKGSLSDVASAIDWLLNESGLKPQVVNMSLGTNPDANGLFNTCPNFMQDSIDELSGQGILSVAAAGNEFIGGTSVPASCSNVFSIGSVNTTGVKSAFSNFSSKNISTTGSEMPVSSFSGSGGFDFISGTSNAAPLVSGVIALAKVSNTALDFSTADKIIRSTSSRFSPADSRCSSASNPCGVLFNAEDFLLAAAPAILDEVTKNPPWIAAAATPAPTQPPTAAPQPAPAPDPTQGPAPAPTPTPPPTMAPTPGPTAPPNQPTQSLAKREFSASELDLTLIESILFVSGPPGSSFEVKDNKRSASFAAVRSGTYRFQAYGSRSQAFVPQSVDPEDPSVQSSSVNIVTIAVAMDGAVVQPNPPEPFRTPVVDNTSPSVGPLPGNPIRTNDQGGGGTTGGIGLLGLTALLALTKRSLKRRT